LTANRWTQRKGRPATAAIADSATPSGIVSLAEAQAIATATGCDPAQALMELEARRLLG